MSKTKAQLQDELSDTLYLVDKYKALFENESRRYENAFELSRERLEKIDKLETTLEFKEIVIQSKDHEIHDLKTWVHCVRGLDYQGKPFPDVKDGS